MDIRHGVILLIQICVYIDLVRVTECQTEYIPTIGCDDTATCPCCSVPCLSNTGDCGGNCLDGYHGRKCYNKCPENCVKCIDGTYGSIGANCTLCKDGYHSNKTHYQCQLACSSKCKSCESLTECTSCMDGYYLTPFKQCARCDDSCPTCISATYCISCQDGYYLDGGICKTCSPLCYSCTSHANCICSNGCKGSGSCDESSGMCYYDCKDNFTSISLYKCESCISGLYGYVCNKSCGERCSTSCDRMSGICTSCKPGYHGDYCDRECPINCFLSCNKTTGKCDTCKHGYYGNTCAYQCVPNCKTCTKAEGLCTICTDGFYGDLCRMNCSINCVLNKCKKESGRCVCKVGYEGDTCQVEVTTVRPTLRTLVPLVVTSAPLNYSGVVAGIAVSAVVVIVISIGLGIWISKHRTGCFRNGSDNWLVSFRGRGEPSIVDVKAKITTLDAEIMKFTEQQTMHVSSLTELERQTALENRLVSVNTGMSGQIGDGKAKIAKIDKEIAKLTEKRTSLESNLTELERRMPYRNTNRADVVQGDAIYETLQRGNAETSQYTSIQF